MKRFLNPIQFRNAACAALLCLVVLPVVQADVPAAAKRLVGKVRVAYADLDLTEQSDMQILIERIEKAAYRACGGNPRRHPGYGLMPRRTETVFEECREDAVARAVGAIDVPVLSQARIQVADE